MICRIVTMCIGILILTTDVAQASVRITEIAWMGTAESQFGEWFELYNDSSDEVNLAGWKLYEDDGNQLIFTMTKSISANGYLLVERTTTSSPDPVPGINDESGTFGGSGFSNSGENLVLKDTQGLSIQILNFSSGWPAGDSETKKTMQWDGSKWVTALATPKAPTISGGGETSAPETPSGTADVSPKVEPRVQLFIPKTVYATISAEYNAKTFLEYGEAWNGVFLWNMGDGTIYKNDRPETIKHTYKYPGKYTVSFGYYRTPYDKIPLMWSSVEKEILSPKIIFSVIPNKGFQFTNTDNVPIDLSGWVIVLPEKIVELPPLTNVSAKTTIVMPFTVFGLNDSYTKATLETPERTSLSFENNSGDTQVQSATTNTKILPLLSREDVFEVTPASAETILSANASPENQKSEKNHLKVIIFGVALVIVTSLFIVIERTKVKQEE